VCKRGRWIYQIAQFSKNYEGYGRLGERERKKKKEEEEEEKRA